jgi:AcrR family transcriptional regulator
MCRRDGRDRVSQSRAKRAAHQRALITAAAFRLFMEQGYESTSYQDIARAAGVERNLVQYYFPKKRELIVMFMNKILRLADSAAAKWLSPDDSPFVRLYLTAQAHFGFLLDSRLSELTLDIVSDRQLTDDIIIFDETWLEDALGTMMSGWTEFSDDMTMAVGGAYELCYRHLSRGETLDATALSKRLMIAFMVSFQFSSDEANALLNRHGLSSEQLTATATYLIGAVVSDSESA